MNPHHKTGFKCVEVNSLKQNMILLIEFPEKKVEEGTKHDIELIFRDSFIFEKFDLWGNVTVLSLTCPSSSSIHN